MRFGSLDIIAPGLLATPCNEAEALGSAVWLWMHSDAHRDAPLQALTTMLLPAIKHRQFALAVENGKPVFYLSWALLNHEAETRYLRNSPVCMPEGDWASGDRMWILDWIAPFGHTPALRHLVTRLFAKRCFRSLHHHGSDRGLRVMEFRGIAVMPEEARMWFERHPVAFSTPATAIADQPEIPDSPGRTR